MKVLMVTPFYYPVIGGTESFIQSVSIELNKMHVDTDIMTFNLSEKMKPLWSEKEELINSVKTISIPTLNLIPSRLHSHRTTFMVNFVPKWILGGLERYDIIHFHNDVDLSFPFFSYPSKKPKILHCHCLDTTYRMYKESFPSRFLFKAVANVYIAASKDIERMLFDLGVPSNRTRVVHNCIDVEEFRPNGERKVDNLLLFVGRLDPKKGLPVLIKSLDHLKTAVRLVIIGPLSYDVAYSKKLLTLIERAGNRTIHDVSYVGVQKKSELIKWYQKASVFVCPSLSEPFGIVNLEALSCETPVIGTNVGGIPEVVLDHENGILVPPNDPVKLAEGIQYLLDNSDDRVRYGKEGREWVTKNFSSRVIAEKLFKIYKEMIN
jgi:glycosyltransferase involved in cell wall biosynthesis